MKELDTEVKIYQFGSSLYSTAPNDIDILIIYTNTSLLKIHQIITFRHLLTHTLEALLKIPIDTILLSEQEAFQMSYLKKINHYRIF